MDAAGVGNGEDDSPQPKGMVVLLNWDGIGYDSVVSPEWQRLAAYSYGNSSVDRLRQRWRWHCRPCGTVWDDN